MIEAAAVNGSTQTQVTPLCEKLEKNGAKSHSRVSNGTPGEPKLLPGGRETHHITPEMPLCRANNEDYLAKVTFTEDFSRDFNHLCAVRRILPRVIATM